MKWSKGKEKNEDGSGEEWITNTGWPAVSDGQERSSTMSPEDGQLAIRRSLVTLAKALAEQQSRN